jgi:hypothetical protein
MPNPSVKGRPAASRTPPLTSNVRHHLLHFYPAQQPYMNRALCIATVAALLSHMPFGWSQTLEERQRGQQFMYCGHLSMRLLRLRGQAEGSPDKYQEQEQRAYMRMLLTAGAYIPSSELNVQYSSASRTLDSDVQAAGDREKSEPGSTSRFLQQSYADCQRHEKAYGQEAFLRGVEKSRASAASSASSAASQ